MFLQRLLSRKPFLALFTGKRLLLRCAMDIFDVLPQRRRIRKRLAAKCAFFAFILSMDPFMEYPVRYLGESRFASPVCK